MPTWPLQLYRSSEKRFLHRPPVEFTAPSDASDDRPRSGYRLYAGARVIMIHSIPRTLEAAVSLRPKARCWSLSADNTTGK